MRRSRCSLRLSGTHEHTAPGGHVEETRARRFPAVSTAFHFACAEIDVRDIDQQRRDSVLGLIQSSRDEIAARRRVQARTEIINADLQPSPTAVS